jgi:hypothetical protein
MAKHAILSATCYQRSTPTLVAVSPGVVEITVSYALRKGSPRIPCRRLRFLLRVSDAAAPNLLPRSVPPRPPFVLRP